MLALDTSRCSLKENRNFIEVNSFGKFKENVFLSTLNYAAKFVRTLNFFIYIFKHYTFYITFDISKENIKFIVKNLWIQIYDKVSSSFVIWVKLLDVGYLWLKMCTHVT